jgi:hypothetical protein
MNHFANGSLRSSRAKRMGVLIAAFVAFSITSQPEAFGQWKLASGFSNANASLPNEVDLVANFAVWGDSIVATAYCATDQLNFPGALPDSIFLSTDHGHTWTSLSPNGGLPFIVAGTDFIGGAQPSSNDLNIADQVLSRSSDGGQTWAFDTAGWINPGGNGMPTSITSIGSTVFISTPFAVGHQTTGSQWTVDTNGLGVGNTLSLGQVGSLFASGNNLFLSTVFSGIFLQTNGGSWSSVNSGLPSYTSAGMSAWFQSEEFASSGSSVFALVAHDTDIYGAGDNFDTVDFYLTTNNGQSWNKMNSTLQSWGLVHHVIVDNQSLFAATDSGFYYSSNNGATWTQAEQGLQLVPGDYPTTIAFSGENIVMGTNSSGAWYRLLSDFGASSVSPSPAPYAGLSLTLSSNPSSGSDESISYTLSDAGAAQVMLMDELGRSVRMLQNGRASAGQNVVALDPQSLTPGTYFIRIIADGTSAMQKLVIAR